MELAFEIEELAHEAEILRSATLATYDAIYNGCNGYEEFDGAFHAVFCMAHDHAKHMTSLMNQAYGLQRNEKKEKC